MMTSLLTISEGRDRPRFVLASADATLTLSGGASVVNMPQSVNGQAAVLGAGSFFLKTRLLCTLSEICCSNQKIYAGVGGKVGQLAPKQCVNGQEKEGGNQTATGEWHGGSKEG
jgi:hypothetical protein